MSVYEQDSTITLYGKFVNQDGSPAIFIGVPQITIQHFVDNSTGKTIDLAYTNMSSLSGTMSEYCYEYHIPNSADKTTYSVTFSGTYSDGTHVLGGEEFLVVPRKFYDRKGGGLVTKVSKDVVWSDFEKKRVLEVLETLLNKRIDFSSIENTFTLASNSILELSGLVEDYNIEVKKQYVELKHRIDEVNLLSNKPMPIFNDSNIVNLLGKIKEKIQGMGVELNTERMVNVIGRLEDIQHELEDFKKSYVLTLSSEQIERLRDDESQ